MLNTPAWPLNIKESLVCLAYVLKLWDNCKLFVYLHNIYRGYESGAGIRSLQGRGISPPYTLYFLSMTRNRELNIFIDESGELSAPCRLNSCKDAFYVVSLVFHDQDVDISSLVDDLNYELDIMKIPGISKNHALHSYNLIRGERPYESLDIRERHKLFNKAVDFAGSCARIGVAGKMCVVDRRHYCEPDSARGVNCRISESRRQAMEAKIHNWLDDLILDNRDDLCTFDTIKVYYDNGQKWLGDLIHESFSRNVVEDELVFKEKVSPSQYKLFQVADLLCTYSLLCKKRAVSDYTKMTCGFSIPLSKSRIMATTETEETL